MWGDEQGRNFGYNLGTQYDKGLVDAYLAAAKAASPRRMPDSLTADYTAQEDILAGYGQARFDIGATNITIGLRVDEDTEAVGLDATDHGETAYHQAGLALGSRT